MYRRPKLKDKIYGEMVWHDNEEFETNWFAHVTDHETGHGFDLLIEVPSQADILAVGLTHPIYRKIMKELNSIRDKMIEDIVRDAGQWFRNKTQKKHFSEIVRKNLILYSITFYQNLSSTITFVEKYEEDEYPEELFYAMLDKDGNFIKAGLEDS